ncbi:hypothetical protein CANARDRAFT_26125 [[Candida] arabinofermentans NRRL YB-2248]|uniref:Uncharacterized protein n=1 Tax=[Candida] arabinofermentans NRRL YB-2248 TaxID=983967 RepID=A0A1E4T867_9ASCO|nr:hypothetical protein CANARDRAFT_26125 [[Candida] arabinofermentans NRRL YB-2248]
MANTKKSGAAKQVKDIVIPEPDAEELYLEKLVFGDNEGFEANLKQIDNLYNYDSQDEDDDVSNQEKLFTYDDSSDDDEYLAGLKNKDDDKSQQSESDSDEDEGDNLADLNDDQLFYVDDSDDEANKDDKMDIDSSESQGEDSESDSDEDSDAWNDSEDERMHVSLLSSDRLKKLRKTEQDDQISGQKYIQRLRSQFERIYPKPEWASKYEEDELKDEQDSDDEQIVDDDNYDNNNNGRSTSDATQSSNPLLQFLKSNQSYNLKDMDKLKLLPPHKIDISRLTDANAKKISKSAIQTLSFHKSHPLLLTGGYDRTLRVYHIDGKVNNLVTSLHLRNSPIQTAAFDINGSIFAGGRRRYMYRWDVENGSIEKISRLYGHEKHQRSFENFKVSSNGKYVGLIGNSGWINILSPKTGQYVKGFKVEGTLIDIDFSQGGVNSNTVLVAVNTAGEVWEFDVENGKVLYKWTDESGLGVTKIKIGGVNNRWISVGNNVGIVNVYDRLKMDGTQQRPKPVGVIENLVTTISSIDFTRDGQVMCIASRDKKDALRLVHLPTCKVFSNWPTSGTPLGKVTAVSFSPNGEMLATGNEAGRVRLWRLNHY